MAYDKFNEVLNYAQILGIIRIWKPNLTEENYYKGTHGASCRVGSKDSVL